MRRLTTFPLSLFLTLGACGGATPEATRGHHGSHTRHGHHGMAHDFSDAEAWAERFEDPARDAWQRPDQVVALVVQRIDQVVADIGSATGYFPMRFARAAPRGFVWGLDVEETLVAYLDERATRAGLSNLKSRVVAPDDPGLAALDPRPEVVFVCNTYHHIGGREAYFRGVREALDPGARLVIVDFFPDSDRGPPRRHKIPPDTVVAELKAAGWTLARREDLPDQYALIFQAAP